MFCGFFQKFANLIFSDCNCDVEGSKSSTCAGGICTCRDEYTGNTCDSCATTAFDNSDGICEGISTKVIFRKTTIFIAYFSL